jgi:hypothetical protein
VQSLDPAVSLTRVGIANGLPRPHVTGRLKRHGSKLTLSYTVRPIPAQHVTFAERGAGGVFRTIGSARGHRGSLTFRPTIAFKRSRVIVAQVTENGLPRATITIARFTAPAVRRLSKPKHLTAHRKATTLTLSWSPVAQARTYLIRVFQGRALIATTLTTHHALRLIGMPGRGVLTVNVQSVGAIQKPGPAARATVR